jgi:mRNA interferase MazF
MVLKAGDVFTGLFAGSQTDKSRPAVVISSDIYHANRPDTVICFLTTQIAGANAPTDYVLQDWRAAGLNQPSAFRAFFVTVRKSEVTKIGHLSDADWNEIQARLKLSSFEISKPSESPVAGQISRQPFGPFRASRVCLRCCSSCLTTNRGQFLRKKNRALDSNRVLLCSGTTTSA